jgi:hypothetical protein
MAIHHTRWGKLQHSRPLICVQNFCLRHLHKTVKKASKTWSSHPKSEKYIINVRNASVCRLQQNSAYIRHSYTQIVSKNHTRTFCVNISPRISRSENARTDTRLFSRIFFNNKKDTSTSKSWVNISLGMSRWKRLDQRYFCNPMRAPWELAKQNCWSMLGILSWRCWGLRPDGSCVSYFMWYLC